MDRATADDISAVAQKLSAMDEPLPEVDAKVAEWIRIQAATVLANLGSPGAQGRGALGYGEVGRWPNDAENVARCPLPGGGLAETD